MSDQVPFRVQPMLAKLVSEPFDKPGWVYEEKYDGYRIVAYKEGSRVTLFSRNAKDRTHTFPGVAQAIAALPARTLALDGEVVVFDRKRVSRFQLLQNIESEPEFAVFDCLYSNGHDLRDWPLQLRREMLEEALRKVRRKGARIFSSLRLSKNGLEAYSAAKRKSLEGVVAKDESSPYVSGRSNKWLKFKVRQEDEFVIVGYTPPAGARQHFGALLLGAYNGEQLHYVGKVGTGFNHDSLAKLFEKFQNLVREKPAVVDPPRQKRVTYIAPRLVAQIAYGEITADGKLRQPVFLGLRDDKKAREVELPVKG